NTVMKERLALENNLRRALERDQFKVYYQPRVNAEEHSVIGCEALLRWQVPGQTVIEPGCFITVAEETGLIIPIGKWVLKTACAQAKAWQDMGYEPFSISVNVSSAQFR